MRNRWGVEVKKGHWVSGRTSRGDAVQGRVAKIERTGDYARAYGPRVILDNGMSLGVDDISQTLGPMTVEDDGTVRQNPLNNAQIKTNLKNKRFWCVVVDYDSPSLGKRGDIVSMHSTHIAADKAAAKHAFADSVSVKQYVAENPLTRVRIKSPPQRPAGNSEAPSKRLMARRKKTAKAPAGVYANPAPGYLYCVWRLDANGKPAYFMRAERSLKLAKEYASALADKAGTPYGIIKKPL